MMQIPQIDNGKTQDQSINASHWIPLPTNTPYGNLFLKWNNIIRRIDMINLEIRLVFESYIHPSMQDINKPCQDPLKHQFYQEQVIYWIRKTTDELISIAYVIDKWKRSGSWPDKVTIDCISAFLKGKPSNNIQELFTPYMEFISILNSVSNTFKHSFINTDITIVGSEYPVVFALALERNNTTNKPIFYQVSFAEIVLWFSNLYKQAAATIRQWART